MTPIAKPRIRVKASGVPSVPAGSVAPRSGPSAGYMRNDTGPVFGNWRPAMREPIHDIRQSWQLAASRAVDMIQNSGFLAGSVDQHVADVVGTGLRLNARPDARAFGLTSEQAGDLGQEIEAEFSIYANTPIDVDAEARKNFGHMQAMAYRHWIAYGEIIAALPYFRRAGGAYGTKTRLILASRVENKSDVSRNIVHGVRCDTYGAALSYFFHEGSVDSGLNKSVEIPARDSAGRPVVVHCFDGLPGQVRGISPLTPVLRVARQFDQLADATLTSSIIKAVFAATITSNEPTADMLRSLQTAQEQAAGDKSGIDAFMDAQEGWLSNTDINLGVNGRIAHLFTGQELNFHEAGSPTTDYEAFAKFLLREVARCLGMTAESVMADWNGTTYTGARVATDQIFKITLYRRKNIVAPFCQAIYEAWLEEAVETGRIKWPGGVEAFLDNRPAATRAIWRGTGKPQPDDLKTAKAHEIWARLGVMSDEDIANELGVDIEDVYEQRAREARLRKKHSLPERTFAGAPAQETQDDPQPNEDA